jgi:peptidyl-tRNA hydrolase
MPLVLHIPKVDPPLRSALLSAAAVATVALCYDERVAEGGPWHDDFRAWADDRIRKVARRARGAHWLAAQELDGVTVAVGDAQARALVPGPVDELDPRIKRLQVGGTDLDHDDPGPPEPGLPVLWVNASLEMTVGKAAAQVGHASMLLGMAMSQDQLAEWAAQGFACSVRDAKPAQWADLQRSGGVVVRDAGFTEVAAGSMTVIAAHPL